MAMAGICTFQFPVVSTFLLVSLLLCVEGQIPRTCIQNECPSYNVEVFRNDFEIRNYKPSVWISTYPMPVSLVEVVEFYFSRLVTYFLGDNNDGKAIKMTAPLLIEVHGNGKKSMSFYLPKENQANPPMARGLHVQRWNNYKIIAVRQFHGFVDDDTVREQVHFLNASLYNDRFATLSDFYFKSDSYIVAQYNSPFESKRMNEIWFLYDYEN